MWETNLLFTECLDVLGNDIAVFSYEKSSEIIKNYVNIKYLFVRDLNDQYQTVLNEHKGKYFYVFWDTGNVPVICAPIEKIFDNSADVTAVGFDTYAVSVDYKAAIIFDHNDSVKLQYI